MSEPQSDAPPALLTRAQVAQRVVDRLDGRLSDAQLARWAFDRFYEVELEQLAYEPGAEEALGDALDELMFGDEPGFALDLGQLRALATRLGAQ